MHHLFEIAGIKLVRAKGTDHLFFLALHDLFVIRKKIFRCNFLPLLFLRKGDGSRLGSWIDFAVKKRLQQKEGSARHSPEHHRHQHGDDGSSHQAFVIDRTLFDLLRDEVCVGKRMLPGGHLYPFPWFSLLDFPLFFLMKKGFLLRHNHSPP